MKIYDCLKVSIVPIAAGVALFGTNFTPVRKVVVPDAAPDPAPLVADANATPRPGTPTTAPAVPASQPAAANAASAANAADAAPSEVRSLARSTTNAAPSPGANAPAPVPPAPTSSAPAPRPVATARPAPAPATAPVPSAPTANGSDSLPELVTFEPLPTAPTLIAQAPAAPVPSPQRESPASPPAPAPQPPLAQTRNTATTQVTVFTIDNQCNDFRQTQITVPADKAIETAIGKVLEERESGDFSLGGYRVNVNGGVATVDLRPAPHSERSLHSLTHCEQLALFGGVRRTLLGNAQWRIQDVQFTIAGEELYF